MSFCVVIVVHSFILNEVLSLNAQEYESGVVFADLDGSSMKS